MSEGRHKVLWVEHSGKNGGKTFPKGTDRNKVQSFRNQKAVDPKVKDAWIVWASLPRR